MQIFFSTSVPRFLFSHVFYFLSPNRVGIEIFRDRSNVDDPIIFTVESPLFLQES